jgi:hypothetical protein
MDAIAYRQKIFNVACAECGAPPGTPCVALMSGRSHKKGHAIAGYHVKRALKAHPPQNAVGGGKQ